jgi:hypothetical protein
MNMIRVIKPYKYHHAWVFDDEEVGLNREPFVSGADTMIDRATADIPNAQDGFLLYFSDKPFPDFQYQLTWLREEYQGNWYTCEALNTEGWLCPALFKYFKETPAEIFVKATPK